jgi:hypothetical protein
MAKNVVQKATTRTSVRLKTQKEKNVQFTRTATRFEQLTDSTFGNLAERTQDGILAYDSATDKFVLVSEDSLLSAAASDGDLPDDFIREIEDEVNLGDITIQSLDGGTF